MSENTLKKIERDENGLVKGIKYIFDDNGQISWKHMIPAEFLYVNPDLKRREKLEKKYCKPYNEIKPIEDNVEDVDLIQLLGATKFLLKLKGYESVEYNIKEANENYCAVNCVIKFAPSYESEGKSIIFSENACAHIGNTNGFGQKYLLEMATNRSLARCVRNALGINIVSKEEISGANNFEEEQPKSTKDMPVNILSKLLKDKNITFDKLKQMYEKDSKDWKELSDIPPVLVFTMIGRIKAENK